MSFRIEVIVQNCNIDMFSIEKVWHVTTNIPTKELATTIAEAISNMIDCMGETEHIEFTYNIFIVDEQNPYNTILDKEKS